MRYFLLFSMLLGALHVGAQVSNLVLFSEGGERFTLYVNGQQINESPEARVVAKGIKAEVGLIKVTFETPGAPVLSTPINMESDQEMTVLITQNKKGKYVLRPAGSVPISEEQQVASVPVTQSAAPQPATTQAQPSNTSANSTSSTTSTNQNNVGMNVNVGGQTFSMNVSVSGTEPVSGSSSGQTMTNQRQGGQIAARVDGNNILLGDGRLITWKYVDLKAPGTKVEMLNPVGAQVTISYDGKEAYSSEVPFIYDGGWTNTNDYFKLEVNEASGYWSVKLKNSNGYKMVIEGAGDSPSASATPQAVASSGCSTPMSADSYDRAKASIESKSFSDEKLTVFKQVIRANCLSASQVAGFMGLFSYEEEKLEVAKLAYPKTVDKGNYYQVNDAFTYSHSIDELDQFLQRQ